jgi:ABC-type amino acid transport substrate-binding protein
LGKELSLKIEWAQELDLSTYLQDLNNGRIDLECSGGWPNAFRGKFVDYTTPIYFNPVYLYARAGLKVDPNNLAALNTPDITFSVMEGETAAIYREKIWPNTKVYTTLGSAPIMDFVNALAYKKADITLTDHMSMKPWLAQNPDKVVRVGDKPIFFIANNMSVPAGETRFLNMLNTATQQMLASGDIERILTKYNVDPLEALRVAVPYQTP